MSADRQLLVLVIENELLVTWLIGGRVAGGRGGRGGQRGVRMSKSARLEIVNRQGCVNRANPIERLIAKSHLYKTRLVPTRVLTEADLRTEVVVWLYRNEVVRHQRVEIHSIATEGDNATCKCSGNEVTAPCYWTIAQGAIERECVFEPIEVEGVVDAGAFVRELRLKPLPGL